MKICSKCKTEKDLQEFYKDKRTPLGIKAQCKKCHTEGSIRTRNIDSKRESNKEFMSRDRINNREKYIEREKEYSAKRLKDEKYKARIIVNSMVKAGKLIKQNCCSKCGSLSKLAAHHSDYTKTLEVEWLCYPCHGKEHRHA